MNPTRLLVLTAALSSIAFSASALTIKNMDETSISVTMRMQDSMKTVSIQPNQTYDAGNVDASLVISNDAPVHARATDHLIIQEKRVVPPEGSQSAAGGEIFHQEGAGGEIYQEEYDEDGHIPQEEAVDGQDYQ